MSGRVEKLLKAYPEMIQKRDCLAYQLAHFKGVSAEDVIASMMTPKVDGERVKSSNLPDKTAQIALEYREKQARMNREWYAYLENSFRMSRENRVSGVRNPGCRKAMGAAGIFSSHTWMLWLKNITCRSTLGNIRNFGIGRMYRSMNRNGLHSNDVPFKQ